MARKRIDAFSIAGMGIWWQMCRVGASIKAYFDCNAGGGCLEIKVLLFVFEWAWCLDG